MESINSILLQSGFKTSNDCTGSGDAFISFSDSVNKNTTILDGNNDFIFVEIKDKQRAYGEIRIEKRKLYDRLNWLKKQILYKKRTDEFYIKAIDNLLRKVNYYELNQEFITNQIQEDEFFMEIENNPDKYTINTTDECSPLDLLIISDIIKKIDSKIKDLSVYEVSEMFSLSQNCFIDKFTNFCIEGTDD